MASPGQLVECVSAALNLPQATVVLYDRVLSENGLRSKGGRGRSAAKVTVEDAANLLIAIAGTPTSGIGSAVAAVKQFSKLKYSERDYDSELQHLPEDFQKTMRRHQPIDFLGLPGMEGLRDDHSFRDGLIALIQAVRHRKLALTEGKPGELIMGDVSLEGPSPVRGVIHVFRRGSGRSSFASYGRLQRPWYDDFGPEENEADFRWKQTFSDRVIRAVANLLGPEDAPAKSKKRDV
jgi:hypothetical protein